MASVCAMLLCEKNLSVKMWGYDTEQLKQIERERENVKFLPGFKLPDSLEFVCDDSKIFADAELLLSAVPCQFTRSVWDRLKKYVPNDMPIVSVTKGIENQTLLRPSEILSSVIGKNITPVTLSGPTIADELARHLPATATVACADEKIAKKVQQTFNTALFRVYRNDDVLGVELCGAVKNVIAIAAGIIDGIKAGDNAKAALLARGLTEIKRLGMAMGANEHTFSGLSGLGDLVTTCISAKGRNRSLGQRIGSGNTLEEALAATDSVVEGVPTCKSVTALAKQYNVEMPITEAVYSILFAGKTVPQALEELMARELKAE